MFYLLAETVLLTVSFVILLPTLVLFVEVAASVVGRREAISPRLATPRIAVVVPAHNESSNIGPTLEDIKAQLKPADRLVVVSDNSSDDTAEVARAAGAEVIERHDLKKKGKGYALDFGLRYLCSDPPDIVIVVDADCRISARALSILATNAVNSQRPVQGLYLMNSPATSVLNHSPAQFAWRIKNEIRPLGLRALNLPCQLMGTGMAFPWLALKRVDLASGHIVEDLKLGLDLAAAGYPPLFCPDALVTSTFSASAQGTRNQRTRWEHGHVSVLLKSGPKLLFAAVAKRDLATVALALDLLVPPLGLLAVLLVGVAGLTAIAALSGIVTYWAAALSLTAFSLFLFAVFLAWWSRGREILPLKNWLSAVGFLASKLHVYGTMIGKRSTSWVRTDRDKV